MKLLALQARGFRSLRDIAWSPGDLNVLIGPNCSGKSNLLRSLELLAISAGAGLERHVQREGGIEPLVWDGRTTTLAFGVTACGLNGPDAISSSRYDLELLRLGTTSRYRIENERLVLTVGEHTLGLLERQARRAVICDERGQLLAAPDAAVLPEGETLLASVAGPFSTSRKISGFQAWLRQWAIYLDFSTHREAPIRGATVARYETLVAPDGQNLVTVLHSLYTGDREFKRTVDVAMIAAFGEEYEELLFPPAADQRVQLRIRWRSLQREQTAAELSDGTLRFLFLLAVLANPQPPPLIAIDEPEIGLHPAMLPIVAEHAVDAALRTQVILTTHSADLLDAFGSSPPTTTVATWKDGETELRTISDEELRYWLERYTLGKLFRSGELEAMQ